MKEALTYIALIVCLVGLLIWQIVIRLREPQPVGIAEMGKIMFWVGLLAALFGH